MKQNKEELTPKWQTTFKELINKHYKQHQATQTTTPIKNWYLQQVEEVSYFVGRA